MIDTNRPLLRGQVEADIDRGFATSSVGCSDVIEMLDELDRLRTELADMEGAMKLTFQMRQNAVGIAEKALAEVAALKAAHFAKLDEAWIDFDSRRLRASENHRLCWAVALEIIEALGGMDPAKRNATG